MTDTPATAKQVREYYGSMGHEVRINGGGRVTHRPDPDRHPGASGAWLEGRWLSDYRVIDGTVHLV